MSIFDYARNKIKKEYNAKRNNCLCLNYNKTVDLEQVCVSDTEKIDKISSLEKIDLARIDGYEQDSKRGLKDAITSRIQAFWTAQTEDERFFIGVTIAVFVLGIITFVCRFGYRPLNIITLTLSKDFFVLFAFLGVLWLYRLIRKKHEKRKVFYVAWALYFILSIPHIPVLFGYQTTQIGDFYEACEYTEEYYVIFSRQPQNNTNRKQYVLPAQIERRLDYSGTTESGYDKHDLNYHIIHLYFSNGGYLSFDYDRAYDDASIVILNQETEVEDYHGDIYYVTLTDEKVKRNYNKQKI